jgi:sorbitol-specific phosphotransferase system component IIC
MTGTFSTGHLVVILIVVALVILAVVALVGVVRAQRASLSDRLLWVLIVVFLPLIGPLLWFFVGRPRGASFSRR